MADKAYKVPDALLVERNYPPGSNQDNTRHQERNRLLGPILGCRRVASAQAGSGFQQSIVTRHPMADFAMYFAKGHPWAGQDRFKWFLTTQAADGTLEPAVPAQLGETPTGDRVFFGYRIEDPYAGNVQVQAAIKEDLDRRIADWRASKEGQEQMASMLRDGTEVAMPELPDPATTPASLASATMPGLDPLAKAPRKK